MKIETKFQIGDLIMATSKSNEVYAGRVTKVTVTFDDDKGTNVVYTIRANERDMNINETGARELKVDNVVAL